jgi:hypothetical protein
MSSKCDFCGTVGTLQLSNNISAAKYPPLTAKNAGQTLMVLRKMFELSCPKIGFEHFSSTMCVISIAFCSKAN